MVNMVISGLSARLLTGATVMMPVKKSSSTKLLPVQTGEIPL